MDKKTVITIILFCIFAICFICSVNIRNTDCEEKIVLCEDSNNNRIIGSECISDKCDNGNSNLLLVIAFSFFALCLIWLVFYDDFFV